MCLTLMVSGCGFQSYLPKPIEPAKIANKLAQRSVSDADFQTFLAAQEYPKNQLPIALWGENELSLSALFFHPDLNTARAQWRAAQAAQMTAAQRPEIGINGSADNHSQSANKSPWTYTLGIDIPIVTAGKREAQIAQAAGLTEAARIEIAQTAWQVHSRVAKSLLEFQYSVAQSAILKNEVTLRTAIADMLVKRMDAGMASSIEVSNARISLQKAEQAYMAESGRIAALGAALANDAGLSLNMFSQLKVQPFAKTEPVSLNDLQYEALLNRLDIRASLARYEAAEAKLRLEIAKQYPDITLSPSKTLDQGDKIWSLGFSSLLTLINKNRGMIAEATALRELEVTQFEALQAKVIGDLNQSKAAYQAALEANTKAEAVLESQQKRTEQAERQFNAGFADRLAFTSTQLENIIATQSVLSTAYQAQITKLNLEDVLQRSLDKRFTMPSDTNLASNNADRNN
ncbi:MAG: TolC family protein [Methylophilaceae bacterium]|nr:TolC family protein [Methylophilaceae bacterium]